MPGWGYSDETTLVGAIGNPGGVVRITSACTGRSTLAGAGHPQRLSRRAQRGFEDLPRAARISHTDLGEHLAQRVLDLGQRLLKRGWWELRRRNSEPPSRNGDQKSGILLSR